MLLRGLSPAGGRARLSVLIFHRVPAFTDPMAPETADAARFDRICGWLARWFRILPLDEGVQALCAGRLPARAAAITFDDGYADNHDQALPILRRHGLTATFFIASGFLDGGRMWNDTLTEVVRRAPAGGLDLRSLGLAGIDVLPTRDWDDKRMSVRRLIDAVKYLPPTPRQAVVDDIAARIGEPLPDDLMLKSEQVVAMRRAGARIGAHTRWHPILASLPDDEALAELRGGRLDLESLLGEPVRTLAYPNGKPDVDYAGRSVRLAREAGFDIAVTTAWGSAGVDVDPLQVPRFTPWDRDALRYGLRMAGNLRRDGQRAATDGGSIPA
jgi:peptidoglycan/xylan/chitin deacetylase (PgdA/CDA1 family)